MNSALQRDEVPDSSSPFGARLRARRKKLDLSQETLGVSIGLDESCSKVRISRYESGTHEPRYSIAKKLAQSLQVPVEYLYCERDSVAELMLAIHPLSDDKIEDIRAKILSDKP